MKSGSYNLSINKRIVSDNQLADTDNDKRRITLNGLNARIPVFGEGGGGLATNKSANQPARPLRLVSAFVIQLLESIMPKLAAKFHYSS